MMNEVSYKSPLYIQLREVIRSKIEDGEYPLGTAIPSENQLAETYSLNRLSVRSAMDALENEGLIKRIQGKGTFVCGPRTQRDMETLGGFRHTMQEHGKDASVRILVKAVRQAGPYYSKVLQMNPDDKLWFIRRVDSSNGEPVALEEIYIPYDFMPNNCIDYYVESGLAFPGGNPVNVAVYLRRLGAEASYLGAVGTDNYGDLLLNRLHEKGVDISHVQRLSGNTALCNVNVVNGERILGDYDEGVMASFSLGQSDYEFLKGFDLVVTGLWGHVESSLERIRKLCVPVAFDGADRPFNPAGRIALQHTDIAFFSDDHLDGEALENKIQDVAGYGPEIVVATRGAKGSVAFDGKQFFSCPPADCVLVDIMGAGDSFIAGFLFAWLQRSQ